MVTVRTDSYRINFGIQKDLHPARRAAATPTPRPTVDARTHARAIYTLVIHRATFLFAAFYPSGAKIAARECRRLRPSRQV